MDMIILPLRIIIIIPSICLFIALTASEVAGELKADLSSLCSQVREEELKKQLDVCLCKCHSILSKINQLEIEKQQLMDELQKVQLSVSVGQSGNVLWCCTHSNYWAINFDIGICIDIIHAACSHQVYCTQSN